MKKVVFLACIAIIALGSCKSSKKAATTPYTPATQPAGTTVAPKVFTVPETKEATSTTKATVTETEKPISVRKESFTFTQPQDQTQNNFFIIIGSFSSMENAMNFRQTLMSEGFTPIVVQSETGYYRVTINSYNNEADARKRLLQVRNDFPKYADTWLLIKE